MPHTLSLNKTNGLPSNAVYDVYQDTKGFIWLATDAGLLRYDGLSYKSYLSSNQISVGGSSIREDKWGRIWYENFDGYLHFIEKDSMYALVQNKPIAYMPIGMTEKHLFLMQKEGIDVYDLKNLNKIKTLNVPILIPEHCTSTSRNFYAIIDEVLYKIDEHLEISKTHFFREKTEKLKQIFATESQLVVIGRYNTSKKMHVFDENLNYLESKALNEPVFIHGFSFIDDALWVHTPNGTWAYSQKDKAIRSYLKDKSISSVLKDRQGNYWFSTTNEGVYLVTDLEHAFYDFEGYSLNRIASMPNGFLVATKKGEILQCDSSLRIQKVVKEKTDNSEVYYLYFDSLNRDVFYSSKGFTQLPQLNYNERIFYELALKEMVKIDSKYYAFAASGHCGLIRTGKDKQVSVWDDYFEKNITPSQTANIIGSVRGKSVAYNPKTNTVYLATNLGLFKTSLGGHTEIKFKNESFFASKLLVYRDKLYALTPRGNLYLIEQESKFTLLNTLFQSGEPAFRMMKLFGDALVIVSSQRIYVMNILTQKTEMIDIHVNPSEINDFIVKNEQLFLLMNNGVIRVPLRDIVNFKRKVHLRINEFRVNNFKRDFEESLSLKHNENDLKIIFSVLDFGSSHPSKLYYRINNGEWEEVLDGRTLQFASLASGNYLVEFKIHEQISDIRLEFLIENPFWKTAWFVAFVVFAALSLGFWYYRWQLTKLKNKNKLLEEKIILEQQLNKSVLTSIKSQMNPHFFYNALNTIQAYIFTNDKTKANTYLAKFSKLTRLILEQSEKESITLGEEVDALTLYLELEKMRFKDDFSYQIHFTNIDSKEDIELPSMIIQPYIENAIKHGLLHKESEKKLYIQFEENQTHLVVVIDDNGIGRKRSAELNKIKNEKYQSFSTQANEKRLEILNKATSKKVGVEIIDKVDANGLACGTKVILTIPIH